MSVRVVGLDGQRPPVAASAASRAQQGLIVAGSEARSGWPEQQFTRRTHACIPVPVAAALPHVSLHSLVRLGSCPTHARASPLHRPAELLVDLPLAYYVPPISDIPGQLPLILDLEQKR